MERRDIILAHTNHRAHEYHLNLIKTLSGEYSIGVLPVGRENKRLDATARLFLDLCVESGAEILPRDAEHACRLLFATQYDYDDGVFDGLDYGELVVLPRFSSGKLGLEKLKKHGAKEIWVYDKSLFIEVLKGEGREDLLGGLEVVEMGSPYKKHPAFDFSELGIDYLIAYPTPMLIRDTRARLALLENIRSAVEAIPDGKTVFAKLHNVKDDGYGMGSGKIRKAEPGTRKALDALLAILAPLNPIAAALFPWDIRDIRARIRDADIMDAAIPLSERTPFHNLGIEHFLPFVREGVITGISACEWHALHDGVPVFNRDPRPLTPETPNYHAYKLFHVPFREGLVFDSADFARIPDSALKADMIELARQKLEKRSNQ